MANDTPETPRIPLGPPAPWTWTVVTRVLEISSFVLTAIWVFHNLGGLALSAKPKLDGKGGVDTTGLYNWHPLLMSLAFPVFMAEAVLAYKKPAVEMDRSQRKVLHASLHTAAIVCIILAIIAAFKSHSLARPVIPNLYSPHSYLGLLTFILSLAQYIAGLVGFMAPRVPSHYKVALSPLHVFLGRATFALGLATMAVGIQEKTSIIQFTKKKYVYSSYFKVPATLQLLLALTAIFVLYHHAPARPARAADRDGLLVEGGPDPEL